MHRLIPAIALALGLHTAHAAEAQAARPAAPPAGVMHAGLTVAKASPERPDGQAARSAQPIQAARDGSKHEEERHPTTAMLLAALALMVAIALRRWGVAQQ